MPSDIAAQVYNTIPKVSRNPVSGLPASLSLWNLDQLNKLGGTSVFLSAREGPASNAGWLKGVTPDANGKTNGAVSSTIITVDRGAGVLDAFYFYFFAFNKGPKVLGKEFGNHVGDWEYNNIRFQDGAPTNVFFSQHSRGQTFTYAACEKRGKRPIGYIAQGTHAVYAISGTHDHTFPEFNLPFGFLTDHTDRGRIWDPTLSAYSYSYDRTSTQFTAYDGRNPVPWLYFNGKWGDDALPASDPQQYDVFGQKHYTEGPTGPGQKKLDRQNVSGFDNERVLPILLP